MPCIIFILKVAAVRAIVVELSNSLGDLSKVVLCRHCPIDFYTIIY
jgi:hypothetical protein